MFPFDPFSQAPVSKQDFCQNISSRGVREPGEQHQGRQESLGILCPCRGVCMGGRHPCRATRWKWCCGTRADWMKLACKGCCLPAMPSAVVSMPLSHHLAQPLPFVGSCCHVEEAIFVSIKPSVCLVHPEFNGNRI